MAVGLSFTEAMNMTALERDLWMIAIGEAKGEKFNFVSREFEKPEGNK